MSMRESTGQKQSPPGRDRLPAGGLEFVALLARLLRRPRRGDRRLPLLWLVRPDGDTGAGPDLMALLRRFLAQGQRRRVPHAVLDVAAQPPGTDVSMLLRELHRQLSLEAFGVARLRFRHYPLADWLMHQSLSFGVDAEEGRSTLVRRLRDRRGARAAGEPVPPGGDAIAVVSQVLLWLVRRAVPGALFRVAVSGRVPLVGRHYRWFMRQQYLAPRQSVTFLGFAERLTAGWRDGEQPDQVNKLLLHAFLEDLRQAYRRRLWRPADWRRTAYPALLLDHVAPGGVGHVLIRLLNDVRNETGRNDPLLVVVAGDGPPPELPEPHPLDEADEAYDEWAEALPEMRRLRRAAAWLVVLRPAAAETGPPPRGGLRPFTAPEPPWWSRRFLPAALCLVVLAAGTAWAATRWGPGCHPSVGGGRVAVELVEGECIGYSDSAAQVFNNDPGQQRLRTIQERIFAQNRAAEEVWERSDRRRPYLTLVYLGTLTGNRTRADEESYVSEREELEGMATAQYALLKESAGADGAALLRIVVANGGRQMRHAGRAVAMLAELARDDPTVLGVVGLVDSRTSTARAMRELNRVGLPVLAPTLSADRLDANSRLYLQISAPNTDQARMVEAYARQVLKVDEAHVYWTTGEGSSLTEDLYVNTLVEGLRKRFGTRITRLEEWRPGRRLIAECGYPGLLFYAGRWSEFDGFLRALRECGDNPPAHLVGDDSVNRYMANPGLRASAPGNIPVTYVSKAALGTCAALRAAQARRDEARASFLTWIQADDLLDPPRCRPEQPHQVGERVSLAYDAAMMMVRAVESLAARLHHADPRQRWEPTAVNPVGVHAEVLRQNAGQGYPGVAGLIRYTPDSGEPVDKRISLMRVERVPEVATGPVEVFHCGAADRPAPPICAAVPATGAQP
ncbi:hypothetical protein [Micromonospora deserti]|nr:hypothetical protein [Micromonospora deserti]